MPGPAGLVHRLVSSQNSVSLDADWRVIFSIYDDVAIVGVTPAPINLYSPDVVDAGVSRLEARRHKSAQGTLKLPAEGASWPFAMIKPAQQWYFLGHQGVFLNTLFIAYGNIPGQVPVLFQLGMGSSFRNDVSVFRSDLIPR